MLTPGHHYGAYLESLAFRFVPALLLVLPAAAGVIVEIRGRITNPFTEAQYRAVVIKIQGSNDAAGRLAS